MALFSFVAFLMVMAFNVQCQLAFSDQSDFENYFNSCSDCDVIEGLTLSGDITDLSPLTSVDVINGDLVISDVHFDLDLTAIMQVDTIQGLLSIQRVESDSLDFGDSGPFVGALVLDDCDSLQIVAVMNNQDFAEHIEISNNDILEEVTVGRRCQYVSGDILIRSNRDLSKLMLTPVVVQIGGSFVIFSSRELVKLGSNYDKVEFIGGHLGIGSLFRLKSISGFNGLSNVESLGIGVIDSVTDITGFSNLTTVNDNLTIDGSRSRTLRIDAFANLKDVGGRFSLSRLEGVEVSKFSSLERASTISLNNVVMKGDSIEDGLFPELQNVSVFEIQGCLNCFTYLDFDSIFKVDSLLFIIGNTVVEALPIWDIDISSLDSLRIVNNRDLRLCSTPWVCDFLLNPQNVYDIGFNAPGCNSRNEIFQNCLFTSDTDETVGELDLELFPNPVRDRLYAESDCEDCTYVIRDMAGQIIVTSEEATIDVSHLTPGSYILQSRSTTYTRTQKFLKL